MSKQKIGVDFNRLKCGKSDKTFAGTWSFKNRVQISSSVERVFLLGGSKLEKNETTEADTLIIHDTAVCLHFRLCLPCKYSTLHPFVSKRLNTNPVS